MGSRKKGTSMGNRRIKEPKEGKKVIEIACECGRRLVVPSSLPQTITCRCGVNYDRVKNAVYKKSERLKVIDKKGNERKETSLLGFFGTGSGGGG
jgi:hypothetical protein